jgi:succinate-semialdehyde dehydrogenase/glutarate-semialdehyde dehydrogenase
MSLKPLVQQEEFSSFIDGNFTTSSTPSQSLISPTTKLPWKKISMATKELIQNAIIKANQAFLPWKFTPAPHRGLLLRQIATLLHANNELLAHVMAMEMGKPIKEGIKEVEYAAGFFSWFAGEAERISGQTVPSNVPNKRLMVLPVPIGVCGIITPWNFPLAMGARKIAAALAAGCTTVVKPSPECPISMLLLAEICRQSSIPPGVVNVLIGHEQEIGQALLQAPTVRKLSFTGSTEIGRYLYRESAHTLKKLTLELGGHAPLIVFDDASIEKAVTGTLAAKFRNNGQTCIAANRILVQKRIYPSFVQSLVEATKQLKVGDPLDQNTDLSNILHPASQKKVQEHIQDALEKGAHPLLLGNSACFPTILEGITPNMKIFHEETFGPVAAITSFDTPEEAIALANQSEYGLAAYVFSENQTLTHITVEALNYGIIGVNDGLPSAPQASFGGVKNSGFGREGGPTGIFEYMTEKFISISL